MKTTWETVRVFISSTFRNMHAERDVWDTGNPYLRRLRYAGVHVLRLENILFGPPVVTPWLWEVKQLLLSRDKKETIHVGCPFCGKWPEISRSAPGTVISCNCCKRNLKLNPFTFRADWRLIARHK